MIAIGLAVIGGLLAQEAPAFRAWVDSERVAVGVPFWVHFEATGTYIELPETIRVAGLAIDPINVRQSSVSPSKERADERTTRRSFFARAQRAGTITIPPIAIEIDGQRYESQAIEVTAVAAVAPEERVAEPEGLAPGEIPKEDLVFIDMAVDRQEVYQGEPIFFRTQLWRILYPNIDSGPYRESRIEWPSTEGFFVRDLEPLSYTAYRAPWRYDVWEERMVLFPTVVGETQIGRWHWEGVALVDVKRRSRRQRLYYDLDAGPIPIHIKAIPEGPETFSGAVGHFECAVKLAGGSFLQGLPAKVAVKVSGYGNPHAMGDPVWPRLNWAQLDGPDNASESEFDDAAGRLRVAKTYTYTLTPLASGEFTVDAVTFTYFDPETDEFRDAAAAPFTMKVLASSEEWQRMVVADDVPLDERGVEILAEDLRPLLALRDVDAARRWDWAAAAMAVLAPVLAYALLAGLTRRRVALLKPQTRSDKQRAAMGRLDEALRAADPYAAIAEAVTSTIAARLGADLDASTAQDVDGVLEQHGFEEALRARVRGLLETCERSRYARVDVSDAELRGLVAEAKGVVGELEGVVVGDKSRE